MRTVIPRNARFIPDNAERVFKGVVYDVYHWPQKMYDGSTATFEMLKRKDTVKVVAVKDERIVLLEEEQPGLPKEYAFPGGRHDVESETELQCAQRELHEETGLTFKSWRLIVATQPSIEIDRCMYVFLATDFVRQEEPHEDGGEKIILHQLTYDQIVAITPTYSTMRIIVDVLKKAGSLEGVLAWPEYA